LGSSGTLVYASRNHRRFASPPIFCPFPPHAHYTPAPTSAPSSTAAAIEVLVTFIALALPAHHHNAALPMAAQTPKATPGKKKAADAGANEELQAVLETVVDLQDETSALRADLTDARRRCKSLEKANQWLVSSRCECVALRIQRWAARERDGGGERRSRNTPPAASLPDVEAAGLRNELVRSVVGRGQALEAENEGLRLQVARLEKDLVMGAAALDALRAKVIRLGARQKAQSAGLRGAGADSPELQAVTEMAGGEEGVGVEAVGNEQGRKGKEVGEKGEVAEGVRMELEMARRELGEAVAGMERERAEWQEKERVSVTVREEERAGWEREREEGAKQMRELQEIVARLRAEVEVEQERAGVAVEKAREEGKQEEREEARKAQEACELAVEHALQVCMKHTVFACAYAN